MPKMIPGTDDQKQNRGRLYKRLLPLHRIVHNEDGTCDGDEARRGRHLIATTNISKGQLIFCERPMVSLQSTGNVHSGVLVCHYCMSFCGSPSQSLDIASNPACLPSITTAQVANHAHATTDHQKERGQLENKGDSSSSPFALIPCQHCCGHVYCSIECQQDDWTWGGHEQLCTGLIGNEDRIEEKDNRNQEGGIDGGIKERSGQNDCIESSNDVNEVDDQIDHPLLKFKRHAIESNEIFLLIAIWISRIHRHMENKRISDSSINETNDIDPRHPYVDFCMNPWWEVACLPYKDMPEGFEEATNLELSLKRLCTESCGFLQAAWTPKHTEEMQTPTRDSRPFGGYADSSWLTPMGMAKLIGSIEQNCMGIRRKHAIQTNVMESTEFRLKHHRQLVACLEQAGMIGGCDDEDDLAEDSDNRQDRGDESGDKFAENIKMETTCLVSDDRIQLENSNAIERQPPVTEQDADGEMSHSGKEAEWDYTPDEIADFLAELPAPITQGEDDDWDVLFTPLDGTAMYSTVCKMNHSCEPNVMLAYKTRGWGRDHPLIASCVALKDIAEGDELTISYITSDDEYSARQEALMNYGFECNCGKCLLEKNEAPTMNLEASDKSLTLEGDDGGMDEEDLFGSDDESDDVRDNSSQTGDGGDGSAEKDPHDGSSAGQSKLAKLVERISSAENLSEFGTIPLRYLVPTSTYVIREAAMLQKDSISVLDGPAAAESIISRRKTLCRLVEQCRQSIQQRDFAFCRIVGQDLESTLYNQLQVGGSWPDSWFRHAYWCGCIVAAVGYAHEGSFLVAIKYLDKALIMGQDRKPIEHIFAYIELHASQMAATPCPPAIHRHLVADFGEGDPELIATLRSVGLSRPIRFPVEIWNADVDGAGESIAKQLSSRSSPQVFSQFAAEWPATKKWLNLSGLVRDHGHRLVPIEVGSISSGMKEHLVSFRSFVSTYLAPSTVRVCWSIEDATSNSSETPIAYLAQHPLLDQIEALYDDVLSNPCGVNPTNINIWMGTGGTRTPLHFDSYDNLLVQLVGAKYVRLYGPDCTPSLYVDQDKSSYGSQGNMSQVDCELEDYLQHPLAQGCQYQEILLLPGDCLFIPAGYWHYVRSLSTSVSVNYWF